MEVKLDILEKILIFDVSWEKVKIGLLHFY